MTQGSFEKGDIPEKILGLKQMDDRKTTLVLIKWKT